MLFAAVYPAIAMEPKEFTEDCALDSCRKSYLEYLFQIFRLYGQLRKTQLIASLCLTQTSEDKNTGDQLRNHSSNSNTCHA